MINEWFKESLPSVPKGDPSKEILTSERYLRPRLSFIKGNMRAYKVIHQKNNILSLRKTFEGLAVNLSAAPTGLGVTEDEIKHVFAFYIQGIVAIIGKRFEGNCGDDIDLIICFL